MSCGEVRFMLDTHHAVQCCLCSCLTRRELPVPAEKGVNVSYEVSVLDQECTSRDFLCTCFSKNRDVCMY